MMGEELDAKDNEMRVEETVHAGDKARTNRIPRGLKVVSRKRKKV